MIAQVNIIRERIKIPANLTAPQTIDVFCFLVSRGKITDNMARDILNCNRLAARVWDLRHAGIDVAGKLVSRKNRKGQTKTYMVYSLPNRKDYLK